MSLAKEYLRRHGLDAPVVYRPDKEHPISLLFRYKEGIEARSRTKWVLLSIRPQFPNGPVFYHIRWQEPVHNSGNSFSNVAPEIQAQWDEYEQEVINITQQFLNMEPVCNDDELKMAMWELFLYLNDDAVSSIPIAVQLTFWELLDDTVPLADRVAKLPACIEQLRKQKNLDTRWQQLSTVFKDNYAQWLGNIFTRMRNDPIYAEQAKILA